MKRHGLPLRPDPGTRPGVAGLWEALWETKAARYRGFKHLELRPDTTSAAAKKTPLFGLDPAESCGYMLETLGDPFISLFITWTVPDIIFAPNEFSDIDHFHTFVGLGFLDLHVNMTVDSGQNIVLQVWTQAAGNVTLPVSTGDVLSASLCLEPNSAGTAYHFIANETTGHTINFVVDTGYPPATTINAGVTRGDLADLGFLDPLASFGAVYFDDISAATENSSAVLLTSGTATTMVDQNGATLASPVILNNNAFKCVCAN